MWLFLLFIVPTFAAGSFAHKDRKHREDCFDNARYITCTTASTYTPSVCDCRDRNLCYIKFIITKVPDHPDIGADPNDVFRINNGRIGPTIIVKNKAVVVVDVFNNIVGAPGDDDTSIHWHGMHQVHVPWMDGVGYVTQWPIPSLGKFRYIFRAKPSGTHWYHSHMRSQREKGLYGALIVRETKRDIHSYRKLGRFTDEPGLTTLSIKEHMVEREETDPVPCFPDKSQMPESEEILESFQVNGNSLSSKLGEGNLEPSFTVQPGRRYRFRLIGSMAETVLRFSIDHHKLYVMATDGYLTQPFETDVLIMHVGERYDFILKADADTKTGTVYPIRVESVAVRCDDFHRPERVGFAYLRYTDRNSDQETPTVKKHESRCKDRCIALNCPFRSYPKGASDVTLECHDVYDVLRLLYPTPEEEMPASTDISLERFFDFAISRGVATVNGIQFKLPKVPFVQSNYNKAPVEECRYQDTHECESEKGEKSCSQTVHIPKQHKMKTIRFVFSGIPAGGTVSSLRTHPIHMHGHSFFVSKIGYPTYDENGEIVSVNEDLTVPECGPPEWTYNVQPEGIRVDSETVRKDVIIVPAGGYVVVEFLADNPGWWFMHCHIDFHLARGMGIVIGELPECQNASPQGLTNQTSQFCYDVRAFLESERKNACKMENTEEGGHGDEDHEKDRPGEEWWEKGHHTKEKQRKHKDSTKDGSEEVTADEEKQVR